MYIGILYDTTLHTTLHYYGKLCLTEVAIIFCSDFIGKVDFYINGGSSQFPTLLVQVWSVLGPGRSDGESTEGSGGGQSTSHLLRGCPPLQQATAGGPSLHTSGRATGQCYTRPDLVCLFCNIVHGSVTHNHVEVFTVQLDHIYLTTIA